MAEGLFRRPMATPLTANIALMASLASLGLGLILAAVGALSARRLGSGKLAWVSTGFLLLSAQGGVFAWRLWTDPIPAADNVFIPSLLGLASMAALYVAVYRRP